MNTQAGPMSDQLAAELLVGLSSYGTYVVAIGDEECEALQDESARDAAKGIAVAIIAGDAAQRR